MFYATDVCCYGRVYNDVGHFYLNPTDTYFILLTISCLNSTVGLRSCFIESVTAETLRLYGKYKIVKYVVVHTVPILVSTGYEKIPAYSVNSSQYE